ncbi:GntR family transcriptional regulator [Frondihabitans cladoniiphilus]|uniref:GntR family transcriptional regulator n=1 Tax=Frondihabitans cladoniiphilus TaxID=715785 RepID=A0ABP8VYN7_9MICO
MPVPRIAKEDQTPRRLLRDVVFDKMLAAIGDGTLELGERLNDDELVTWLGVSRTPVREAMAKLADYGLVDIEANRYTRVIKPTLAEAADTLLTAAEFLGLVAERAIQVMSDDQADAFVAQADEVLAAFDRHDADFGIRLGALLDALTTATDSPALQRMSETLTARAALITRITQEANEWAEGRLVPEKLRDAVASRDPQAAWAVVPGPEFLTRWSERVSGLDLFSA